MCYGENSARRPVDADEVHRVSVDLLLRQQEALATLALLQLPKDTLKSVEDLPREDQATSCP